MSNLKEQVESSNNKIAMYGVEIKNRISEIATTKNDVKVSNKILELIKVFPENLEVRGSREIIYTECWKIINESDKDTTDIDKEIENIKLTILTEKKQLRKLTRIMKSVQEIEAPDITEIEEKTEKKEEKTEV
jgi:esterase/lipase